MGQLGYFATIHYDDSTQDSYECIEITDRTTGEKRKFEVGCPVIDHVNYMMWLSEQDDVGMGVVWSSSYDHFLMDGDYYVERYVGYRGSDNPDDWVFVDWKTEPYEFSVLTKSEFTTFQEHRAYYKEWKSKQS